jgi:TRAP-type C4-dicarboxylate transport system permease large subunit
LLRTDFIKYGLGILCFVAVLLYLADVFFPLDFFVAGYSIAGIILLAFAIFSVRLSNKITISVLVLIGSVIFINRDASTIHMIQAFGRNINLLTLFLAVPFIGIIISVGGYLTALKHKVQEQERKGVSHPYLFSTLLNSSMGMILNLGSMLITYRIAEESFTRYRSKIMGMVLLRAFAFCMLWSPYFVTVGLVTVLFDVSWVNIGWIGLLLGLVYFAICGLFFAHLRIPGDLKAKSSEKTGEISSEEHGRKLRSLLLWTASLLILSFYLDYILDINMLTIVSLLALVFPFIWSMAIGVTREYMQNISQAVIHSFGRLKNELGIFISAGYFGVSLTYTNLGELISNYILHFSNGSTYLLSILIVLFTIVLAMIGIHPVILLIGIGSSLSPVLFGVSPEFLAVLLLLAATLGTIVSPFTGAVITTAGLIDETPWFVVKHNALFVIVLVLVLPLVLYMFLLLGWV